MKEIEPNIGRLIARIHREIYNHVADRLKSRDVDVGQFFLLRFILKNTGLTQEQIAKGLSLDKTTVSKGIKRLVELGYITKVVNPDDKREYKIFSNKKAVACAPEIEVIFQEIYSRLLRNLTEDEIEQVQSLLTTIYKNFE